MPFRKQRLKVNILNDLDFFSLNNYVLHVANNKFVQSTWDANAAKQTHWSFKK